LHNPEILKKLSQKGKTHCNSRGNFLKKDFLYTPSKTFNILRKGRLCLAQTPFAKKKNIKKVF